MLAARTRRLRLRSSVLIRSCSGYRVGYVPEAAFRSDTGWARPSGQEWIPGITERVGWLHYRLNVEVATVAKVTGSVTSPGHPLVLSHLMPTGARCRRRHVGHVAPLARLRARERAQGPPAVVVDFLQSRVPPPLSPGVIVKRRRSGRQGRNALLGVNAWCARTGASMPLCSVTTSQRHARRVRSGSRSCSSAQTRPYGPVAG